MDKSYDKTVIQAALDEATANHIFPCGVLAQLHRGKAPAFFCSGKSLYGDGGFTPDANSLFDLASLTKVIATTSLVMLLFENGSLDLDSPVSTWLPDFM